MSQRSLTSALGARAVARSLSRAVLVFSGFAMIATRVIASAIPVTPPGALNRLAAGSPRARRGRAKAASMPVIQQPLLLGVRRIDGFSPERLSEEAALREHQVILPLSQRMEWQQAGDAESAVLLVVENGDTRPAGAVAATVSRSRALPLHRIYRVERFGAAIPAIDRARVSALARMGRDDPLCLRMSIEVFERDPELRARLRALLSREGFHRRSDARMYERTYAMELRGTEDELFSRLNSTARRHVRAPAKRGLELRKIVDTALGPRLDELMRATFLRTHGSPSSRAWDRVIAMAAADPASSRIIGLFDPAVPGAEGLLSFALACSHGPYVSYEAGASIRRPDLGNTPLSYAPLWDLIAWARRETSATWFDLGGAPANAARDARAGISEFKEYFSDNLVDVGEEWQFEPHPVRGAMARLISRSAGWAGRSLRRTSPASS